MKLLTNKKTIQLAKIIADLDNKTIKDLNYQEKKILFTFIVNYN